jgi:hypothetical protein
MKHIAPNTHLQSSRNSIFLSFQQNQQDSWGDEKIPNMRKKLALAIGFSAILIVVAVFLVNWGDNRSAWHDENLLVADADGDGLADNIEVAGWYVNLQSSYLQTSDPLKTDTDNDGLSDFEEYALKTDPRNPDTDGDNLSDVFESENVKFNPTKYDTDNDNVYDGMEFQVDIGPDNDKDGLPDLLETEFLASYGANPNRRDIFVEIDKMDCENTQWLTNDEKAELVLAFKNALIQNPDGSMGVDLHLIEDEVVPYANIWDEITDNAGHKMQQYSNPKWYEAFKNYAENYRTYREGFYYCAIMDGGAGSLHYGFSVTWNDLVVNTFMHELGHSMGLGSHLFDGIDSTKYTFNEYPSVMNYNSLDVSSLVYSSEEGFDDWGYLENNGFYLRRYSSY